MSSKESWMVWLNSKNQNGLFHICGQIVLIFLSMSWDILFSFLSMFAYCFMSWSSSFRICHPTSLGKISRGRQRGKNCLKMSLSEQEYHSLWLCKFPWNDIEQLISMRYNAIVWSRTARFNDWETITIKPRAVL